MLLIQSQTKAITSKKEIGMSYWTDLEWWAIGCLVNMDWLELLPVFSDLLQIYTKNALYMNPF